jgi:hypothetical protein
VDGLGLNGERPNLAEEFVGFLESTDFAILGQIQVLLVSTAWQVS